MLLLRAGCTTVTGFVHLFGLSRVLLLIACEGKGNLVVSEWSAAYFLPFVNPINGSVECIVKDCFSLPVITPLFIRRRRQFHVKRKTVFAESRIFRVLAIRLDCAYLSTFSSNSLV